MDTIPYIIDLNGLESATIEKAKKQMGYIASFGPKEKGETGQWFFLCRKMPLKEMAVLLSLDKSRIKTAEGWDLNLWLGQ